MSDIRVGAEDNFALVDMLARDDLAPHPFVLANVAQAMETLAAQWRPLWDLRTLRGPLYDDVTDAFAEAVNPSLRPVVLVEPSRREEVEDTFRRTFGAEAYKLRYVEMRARATTRRALDLSIFEDDADVSGDADGAYVVDVDPLLWRLDEDDVSAGRRMMVTDDDTTGSYWEAARGLGMVDEPEDFARFTPWAIAAFKAAEDILTSEQFAILHSALQAERAEILQGVLASIASASLLTQIGLISDGRERVRVVPLHAHSIHFVEGQDDVVPMRPGRRSPQYQRLFADPIRQLERLINEPRIKEREIERLLLDYPLFLSGLNYKEVYSQVVLPRFGTSDLRPDIIAEPFGDSWADIIELKLPIDPIVVKGKANRPRLHNAIADAVEQLREYRGYFENRELAERVEKQHGFRCFRPKLMVIIGRDPARFTPEQRRNALSSYPDIEFVTYDKLIRAARSRLLL